MFEQFSQNGSLLDPSFNYDNLMVDAYFDAPDKKLATHWRSKANVSALIKSAKYESLFEFEDYH